MRSQTDGGWGGDHGVPTAICAAGDNMVLSWDFAEAGCGLIRTNVDGKKKWGIAQNPIFLASDGERIYGGYQRDERKILCFYLKDGRPLAYADGTASLAPPPGAGGRTSSVTGLACADGKVYVAFSASRMVAIYDAKTGALLTTWSVPMPGQMAALPGGGMAVISDGRKLVTVKDGKVAELASDHVDAPTAVAVDAKGSFYVSNRGKLQNASVFSPEGKYIRSIGKEGGRPTLGRFDPAGMLRPAGVAIGAKGPRRPENC